MEPVNLEYQILDSKNYLIIDDLLNPILSLLLEGAADTSDVRWSLEVPSLVPRPDAVFDEATVTVLEKTRLEQRRVFSFSVDSLARFLAEEKLAKTFEVGE